MTTQERVKALTEYFRSIRPNREYLSELLGRVSQEQIETAINKKETLDSFGLALDGVFLSEAMDFLSMGILNFLAYKHLMGGGYRSWGFVTLYYSNFYAANCLLRLVGLAIAHIEWMDPRDLLISNEEKPRYSRRKRVLVERVSGTHSYVVKKLRQSEHQLVFGRLPQHFPDMLTERIGDLIREDRARENYELRFPSQGLESYSLDIARQIFEHDFAVPGYGAGWDPNAAEYLSDLYASYGYKEDYSAQWIKECTALLTELGRVSRYKRDYEVFFKHVLEWVGKLGSKSALIDLVKSWLDEGLAALKSP
jgi:hypothetical protein